MYLFFYWKNTDKKLKLKKKLEKKENNNKNYNKGLVPYAQDTSDMSVATPLSLMVAVLFARDRVYYTLFHLNFCSGCSFFYECQLVIDRFTHSEQSSATIQTRKNNKDQKEAVRYSLSNSIKIYMGSK